MFGASKSGSAAAKDPQFNYVAALLNGDGTNGAQNNTFIDSSTNNFTVTPSGNATQGSFTPYNNTWSMYFPGSAYFTSAALAANQLTGNYTIEFWFNQTVAGKQGLVTVTATASSGGAGMSVYIDSAPSNSLTLFIDGNTTTFTTTTNIFILNTWNHVAVVYTSSATRGTLYLNGTCVGNLTRTATFSATPAISIGRIFSDNVASTFNGYISNVRILKSTALYTGTTVGTSYFTPPTAPLTAITNTYLLTLQSNRFIDNSSSALTFTATGSPSVQKFSPFSPTAYTTSSNGGSAYFDGTGDYLTVSTLTAATGLGSGNWTFECWFYASVTKTFAQIIGNRSTATGSTAFVPIIVSYESGVIKYYTSSNGTSWNLVNAFTIGSVSLQTWNHIAIVRNGANLDAYLNGIKISISTGLSGISYTATNLFYVSGANDPFQGYVSNIRLVTGTVVYTANFTPPTSPVTAITNTSFLVNGTNAGIYDSAMISDFETVGNAQVSTSVKKYGTGSMSFDGTGDWLICADTINQQFNLGDFTLEGWVYLNAIGVAYSIVSKGASATGWSVGITAANKLQISYTAASLTGTTSLVASTWYYFTAVRLGTAIGNIKIYLNGVLDGSSASAVNDNFNQTTSMYVGASRTGTTPLNGYIDDLRVTKGVARYTANFTPPTAPLPTS